MNSVLQCLLRFSNLFDCIPNSKYSELSFTNIVKQLHTLFVNSVQYSKSKWKTEQNKLIRQLTTLVSTRMGYTMMAKNAWTEHMRDIGYSEIVGLFYYQIMWTKTCSKCHNTSYTFTIGSNITLKLKPNEFKNVNELLQDTFGKH